MLRIIESRSAEQAKSYYTEGLSREDYYVGEQEVAGRWGGEGAKRLGLVGKVERDPFAALCENRMPDRQGRLTARYSENRRVGYDINFHAPKSVSLLYALTEDRDLLGAFQAAIRDTMLEMEQGMETRVRRGGRFENRTTANMAWAEFVHFTSRPVEGRPDPHLHCHCFAFNATWDPTEERWKAGDFGSLKRDAPYYEAIFHARFAKRVRELGYGIERRAKGWDIAGIDRVMIERFSQRTARIEALAAERGIRSDRMKDQLGAATREHKKPELSIEDLREEWRSRLNEEERGRLHEVEAHKGRIVQPDLDAKAAMDHALDHSFERGSVIPEKRLLANALWRGVGAINLADLRRELAQDRVVTREFEGQTWCTTREVLAEEREMIEAVRQGKGTCKPLHEGEFTFQNEQLSDEQKAAVLHVLKGTDWVTGIRGAAGTGKTTLLKETVAGIERGRHRTLLFAPSAEASRGVLRDEGFAEADTVARLLQDEKLQERIAGQVVWIDEAGLVGSRTMKRVLDLAQARGARVVLSGDTRQHHAVERGDSLRLLEEKADLATAELRTIRRQQGQYREAITAISEGRIEAAFAQLDELEAIRTLADDERYQAIADGYLDLTKRGRTALVVSPTHREGALVTERIREGRRAAGQLATVGKERVLPSLKNLSWTEAERADPVNYEAGLAVQFFKNAKGITRGEKLTVSEVERERGVVMLRNDRGEERELPLDLADRFQVYEVRELPVAPGEIIRFTQNGSSKDGKHRLHNGTTQELEGFTEEGDLRLANGWVVDRNYGNLTHGYVTTSHASQGKTVDHVLIAQSVASWAASSREQFYVSASRGRRSVRIYTDDREQLLDAVLGSSTRLAALDLEERGLTPSAPSPDIAEIEQAAAAPSAPVPPPSSAPEAQSPPPAPESSSQAPPPESASDQAKRLIAKFLGRDLPKPSQPSPDPDRPQPTPANDLLSKYAPKHHPRPSVLRDRERDGS